MLQKLRTLATPRLLAAVLTIGLIGGLGSYFLASSNAQTPAPLTQVAAGNTLKPYSLGTAPYQYIAYSGAVDETRAATGIKQYFAAFIISAGGCTPAWGGNAATGLASKRSADIAADFAKLRAAGGDVAVSFGGSNGTELATSCKTVPELTAAYQRVIDTYAADRVDFDIEGSSLNDEAGNDRRAEAIKALQKANPALKVWITLPVHTKGLTPPGLKLLDQLNERDVTLSGINIMAMNYNINSKEMGRQAITAAEATYGQLHALYPDNTPSEIWKAMGITVMIGRNNTVPETLSIQNAAEVRQFVTRKGIGMLSMWNAGRDVSCSEGPTADQPSISCSGVVQQPYDYMRALTVAAVQ